jgi:hypothetical protein
LLEVVSLPWEINSKTQDDAIWIRFNISEEVKFKLILADAFLGIIDILNTSISLTNSVFDSINNVGEYINIASNLIIAQTVVSALSAVVSAIYPNSNCNCNDK